MDCSALVPTLIESELFGYVKGAFTGAVHSKLGLTDSADGGTVFLDEIGDLPLDLQVKLLRVLQEKEIRPVGSTERISISTRVIAATNRDLQGAVRRGAFRQDLFFRLNVVQIKLPPLLERKSDIPLLVSSFLEKFSEKNHAVRTISEDAMARLIAYDWPGNVRELENAIERAVALGSGPILHAGDLPSNLQYGASVRASSAPMNCCLSKNSNAARFCAALRESAGDKTGRGTPARNRQNHALPQTEAIRRPVQSSLIRFFSLEQAETSLCMPACVHGDARFLDRDVVGSKRETRNFDFSLHMANPLKSDSLART